MYYRARHHYKAEHHCPGFSVGDKVVYVDDVSANIRIKKGDTGTVTASNSRLTRVRLDKDNEIVKRFTYRWGLRVNNFQKEEAKEMKNVIAEVYEKTQDALLVENHILCIKDTFTGKLLLKANKAAYLAEAKRLDKIAKERE